MRGGLRARDRRDLTVRAEINVTSLVDVAFTLLVIFIITAPALQGGVEVAVPRGDVESVTATDDILILSIDRNGDVFLGETPVERAELETQLPQLLEAFGTQTVYVKGDSLSTYAPIFQVITAVAHLEDVSFALIGEEVPPASR